MHDNQRLQLHFGPYMTPRFKYGSVVWDEARGYVKILGMTDAPIPWPVGKPPGMTGGSPSLVLYRGLVKAVQRESNQAVAHWWGVSGQTVTKWRKALEVLPTNDGRSRLRSAYAHEEPLVKARQKALDQFRDPALDGERRAKIAAAKTGKSGPAHVMESLRKANLDRPLDEDTRKKMSEAHRRRGTRPPWLNSAWTAEEEELLRTLPAAEVARRTGGRCRRSTASEASSSCRMDGGRTDEPADI